MQRRVAMKMKIAVVLMFAISFPLTAQELTLKHVVELGRGADEGTILPTMMVALTPTGFAVSDAEISTEIRFFGFDGRLKSRVGRAGDGPGEYRKIAAILTGSRDSLWVYDRRLSRMSILNSQGTFERSFALPPAMQSSGLVLLPDQRLAMAGKVGQRGGTQNQELLLLGPTGTILSTMSAPGGSVEPMAPGSYFGLAPSSGSVIWLFDSYGYRIYRWDVESQEVRSAVDLSDRMASLKAAYGDLPPPMILGVSDIGADRLLVFLRVQGRSGDLGGDMIAPDPQADFDTLIHLVDMTTGAVLREIHEESFPIGPIRGPLIQANRQGATEYWVEILEAVVHN